MSTAIIVAYTPDGFIMAADGRGIDSKHPTKHDDSVQKIFAIQDAKRRLAFMVSGSAVIGSDGGEDFSFVAESNKAAEVMRLSRWRDLEGYGGEFSRIINKALRKAKATGRIAEFPADSRPLAGERGNTIARIILAGYYDGWPSRIEVRFWHDKQSLSVPNIRLCAVEDELVWGSRRVEEVLRDTRDQRLSSYKAPPPAQASPIEQAVHIATNYIRACSDPEALQVDEENCRAIGGRIHVASITPDDGFQWVPGYDPGCRGPIPGSTRGVNDTLV
jgi:hypothetical protein